MREIRRFVLENLQGNDGRYSQNKLWAHLGKAAATYVTVLPARPASSCARASCWGVVIASA